MSIEITHSMDEGTLVDGTARGDGSAEILKRHRFRWSRNLGQWFIPQSRDRIADRYRISRAADDLRAAGFDVTVTIDNAAQDAAEREERRNERAEQRADNLMAKAERKAGEAERHYQTERQILDIIPPGQPILVGHHSERRHRRDLERAESARRKASEARSEAHSAQDRAEGTIRAARHRMTPDYIGNRIAEREADERKLQRNLSNKDAVLSRLEASGDAEKHQRYTDWFADCEARLEQVRADLDYFRGQIAEMAANGRKIYTKADIKAGDLVKIRHGWAKVERANPKTVSVLIPGISWTMKYRYTEIRDHRSAGAEEVAA